MIALSSLLILSLAVIVCYANETIKLRFTILSIKLNIKTDTATRDLICECMCTIFTVNYGNAKLQYKNVDNQQYWYDLHKSALSLTWNGWTKIMELTTQVYY